MREEKSRITFECNECGARALRWEGRCPSCGQWNTLNEVTKSSSKRNHGRLVSSGQASQELSDITPDDAARLVLPMGETNRVLGGGLVKGSMILLGGDPGIGKSTLLLQLSANMADKSHAVLYISGEESAQQLKIRADRLGIHGKGLYILSETDMESILNHMDIVSPTLVIIDSIQSVGFQEQPSGPGSISQVRECGLAILNWSKIRGITTIVTGHVTKDGNLAGPKSLEHMVDVVLYLEGEDLGPYRILRGEKNRYGSTNEIAILEMKDKGLVEVSNPSEISLASMDTNAIGSVVVPVIEGTRPLLVEIQALVTPSYLPSPRRVANGVDMGRLLMVIAVLGKRASMNLSNQDIIINVAGGFRATEPAADLGIAVALISSLTNTPVLANMATIGEIGLGGEIRNASQLSRRTGELLQMGFEFCICPSPNLQSSNLVPDIKTIGAKDINEALQFAFD